MWVACGVQRAVERRLVPVLGARPALEDATHTRERKEPTPNECTNECTNDEYTNERTNERKVYGSLKVLVPYMQSVACSGVRFFVLFILITYFITVIVSSGSFVFLVLLHFHIYLIFLGLDLIF